MFKLLGTKVHCRMMSPAAVARSLVADQAIRAQAGRLAAGPALHPQPLQIATPAIWRHIRDKAA